jgi:hypothetical protein
MKPYRNNKQRREENWKCNSGEKRRQRKQKRRKRRRRRQQQVSEVPVAQIEGE